MTNKQTFDTYVGAGLLKQTDDLERIKILVNILIDALYVPVMKEVITKVDGSRLKRFNVDGDEPINWGDLKCIEVTKGNGVYHVTIDEASPNDCQTFCEYIEKYMLAWGWEVRVKTEW